jgi:hypothetical protein
MAAPATEARTLAGEARRVPLWWAASHTLVAASSSLYVVALLLGLEWAPFLYKTALKGALAGNALAVYHKTGVRQADAHTHTHTHTH